MSMDASLERVSAVNNKFPPTSLKRYPESSESDLPEKLAFLVRYGRMFTLLSGPYGQTERLKEQLTVELQAFNVVLNIDAIDLDVENLPHTLLSRCMAQDTQTGSQPKPYEGSRLSREQAIAELKMFSKSLAQSCRKAILIVSGRKIIKAKVLSELMVLSEKVGISLVLFSEKSLAEKRFLKPFVDQIYSVHLGSLSIFDLKRYIRRTRTDDAVLSSRQLEMLVKESAEDPARVDDLVERIISEPKRPIGLSLIHLSMVATLVILLASVFFVNDRFQSVETVNVPIAVNSLALNGRALSGSAMDSATENRRDSLGGKDGGSTIAMQGTQSRAEVAVEPEVVESRIEAVKLKSEPDRLDIERLLKPDKTPNRVIVGGTTSIEGARALRVIEPTKLQRTVLKPAQSYATGLASSNYTLQLVGSGSEEAIKALIGQQTSDIELEYFKTRRGAQDWYILTAGNFGSREAALLAVSSLPLDLKNMKPWARAISSIQGVTN